VDEPERLSVTEAGRRGVARLVGDAAHGRGVVVERHGRPVAAVVDVARLDELTRLRDDLRDLALVIGRAAADDGRRTPLDEVVDAFGRARRG
jgi:prevent-host-death family protein